MDVDRFLEDRVRNPGVQGETPGFLERRDSRGLYPDVQPDPSIVRKIQRIDPRWRVQFNRKRGRWCLYHVHERFGVPKYPTKVLQGEHREYRPLDMSVVREIEIGAYLERNSVSPEDFDEKLHQLREAHAAREQAQITEDRKDWLRDRRKGLQRGLETGDFWRKRPDPPKPLYFT